MACKHAASPSRSGQAPSASVRGAIHMRAKRRARVRRGPCRERNWNHRFPPPAARRADHPHGPRGEVVRQVQGALRHRPGRAARRADRGLRAFGIRQVDPDPLHQPTRNGAEGTHRGSTASHEVGFARSVADRVIFIASGRSSSRRRRISSSAIRATRRRASSWGRPSVPITANTDAPRADFAVVVQRGRSAPPRPALVRPLQRLPRQWVAVRLADSAAPWRAVLRALPAGVPWAIEYPLAGDDLSAVTRSEVECLRALAVAPSGNNT